MSCFFGGRILLCPMSSPEGATARPLHKLRKGDRCDDRATVGAKPETSVNKLSFAGSCVSVFSVRGFPCLRTCVGLAIGFTAKRQKTHDKMSRLMRPRGPRDLDAPARPTRGQAEENIGRSATPGPRVERARLPVLPNVDSGSGSKPPVRRPHRPHYASNNNRSTIVCAACGLARRCTLACMIASRCGSARSWSIL